MNIHEMTTEEAATLLSVTPRAVRKWAQEEGLPHRFIGKDLRFDWPQTLTWWTANKCRGPVAAQRGSSTPPKVVSEAQILATKARMDAIKLAEREGRMIDLQLVEDEWTRKILACRGRLLTIPARLRGPLGQEIAKRVEDEVFQALTELAKEWPDA
nr:helix-turn-helix domain-containing protein [uncultured Holophaga sp.]